jgi:hypothetical protein
MGSTLSARVGFGAMGKSLSGRVADSLTRIFAPSRDYRVEMVNGRFVGKIPRKDGSVLEIGYLVDNEGFMRVAGGLNPLEKELLLEAEIHATEIERGAPRYLSGLDGASHVRGVELDYAMLANELKIEVEIQMLLMATGHDFKENHASVKALVKEWEAAKESNDHRERKSIEKRLTTVRQVIGEEYISRLRKVFDQFENLPSERGRLEGTIAKAERGIDHLTRYVEAKTYAHSIHYQFSVKGGQTPVDAAREMVIKLIDSRRNDEEVREDENLKQVYLLFNDPRYRAKRVVGKDFTDRFGRVKERGADMSRTARLRRVVGDIFKLQEMNAFLNAYGGAMQRGVYGQDGQNMYKMLLVASQRLREASLALTKSAKEMYSEREIGVPKESIEREAEDLKRNSRNFDGITTPKDPSEPTLMQLNAMDVNGRRQFYEMDERKEGRLFLYKALVSCGIVLDRFGRFHLPRIPTSKPIEPFLLDGRTTYDPAVHKLFVLRRYGQALRFSPDYFTIK